MTELTLIRLTRPDTGVDADALSARLERLEQRVQGIGASRDQVQRPVGGDPSGASAAQPAPRAQHQAPPRAPDVPGDAAEDELASTREAADVPARDLVPAAPEQSPVADVDLATFESAWPAIAARMRDLAGPSRHALLKEVRPVRIDNGTAVFELPSHLPFHLQQLRADTQLHELLARAAAEFVGGTLEMEFRAQSDTIPVSEDVSDPARVPDKNELLEEDEGAIDPTDLVVDMLGGEVVEDQT